VKNKGESMEREIKILLVEDNDADAVVTKRLLKFNQIDNDLVLAKDGQEALENLQRRSREGNLPNLILLDINLPDISGIDLLTSLRNDNCFCKIPVVILTGSNEDHDIQKSYDLGARSYLVKPISNEAMMQVIEKLFSP
jgi:two-component system response regulator